MVGGQSGGATPLAGLGGSLFGVCDPEELFWDFTSAPGRPQARSVHNFLSLSHLSVLHRLELTWASPLSSIGCEAQSS